MSERILLVDDDLRIVNTLERTLHNKYEIETATSPAEGLSRVLDRQFAVVVSDLTMPQMNGIELLRKVKSLSPQTVGILLTGWADLETAIQAVNDGHIFRFLRKPCPHPVLTNALDAALGQYSLVCAEKDILRDTLIGILRVMIGLLACTQPETFGHVVRIDRLTRELITEMNLAHAWEIEAAGLLSQIGCISVSPRTIDKYFAGIELSHEETQQVLRHPQVGSEMVKGVLRLRLVASMIRHQMDAFHEAADVRPETLTVAIGSQILRVAIDFERTIGTGISPLEAVRKLRENGADYNAQVLDALERLSCAHADSEPLQNNTV